MIRPAAAKVPSKLTVALRSGLAALGIAATLPLAACGPSALELKTAADAAAETAAKLQAAVAEAAKLKADAAHLAAAAELERTATAKLEADAATAAAAMAAKLQATAAEVAQLKTAAADAAKADAAAKLKCKPNTGMKPIPAGTFTMGSSNGDADEKPAHSVEVAAFCMDATEVTMKAYTACVRTGLCQPAHTDAVAPGESAAVVAALSKSCNQKSMGREAHPVNCVDWNQATAYCKAQGQRLPTEEEWEYAARGTDGRTYPWGNDEPDSQLCWNRFGERKPNSTCTVGSFSQGNSPFGLADMAGNVWEWTSSGYSANYTVERDTAARVIRGGGWGDGGPSSVRSASAYEPALRSVSLGFRCAGSLFP